MNNKKCEMCENNLKYGKRFCSRICQGKWQSLYLRGEKANNYKKDISIEQRKRNCDYCGEEYFPKLYNLNAKNGFCSKKCSNEWFAKVWSQTEENKEAARSRAGKILENMAKTQTAPHLSIIKILDELNIDYQSEKNFNYFAIDIYLPNYNLAIEIMGGYWHGDIRKYKEINYNNQVNRIRLDKSKHTYIKQNFNINILYLWEEDILKNIHMCKKLILEYIKNNGILKNYHSINYIYSNKLQLTNNILTPYMEWNFEDFSKIIKIEYKNRTSYKQENKWIKFDCDYCKKPSEQLIKKYNKQKKHYCCKQCGYNDKRDKVEVKCNNCGNNIKVIKSKFEKNLRFFCNQKCQHEYQRDIGFKKDVKNIEFKCNFCNKKVIRSINEYKKYKKHYCNNKCAIEDKKTILAP